MSSAILRPKDARDYLSVSKSTFYNLRKQDPSFPKPIQLTDKAIGWLPCQLDEWLKSKVPDQRVVIGGGRI